MYDLIVIGGGPGGYTAAARAASKGVGRVLLIEKNALGGTCLNEGCIPAKTLLHSAKLWQSVKGASKYGVVAEAVEYKQDKVIARKNKIVRKLVAGVKAKVTASGAEILLGEASVVAVENNLYTVQVGEEQFQTTKLILAQGGEVSIPPIKGLDRVSYWTSREALSAKELPQDLTVIGGGVIGMEFAAYFCSVGVKVNVVEMLPEILGGLDREISSQLREEYSKLGVNFYLNAKVVEVSPEGVTIEHEGETKLLPASQLLLSTGRRPQTKGLEVLGLEMQGRGVKVNAKMETSAPGVYAIGDLTGFSQLAHTAIREAEVAVDNILGNEKEISYRAIPAVVYCTPEVAGVGYTEEQLQKENIPYNKASLNMTYAGRFVVENEQGSGLCKVLIGEKDEILGVHMLGNTSSEIIVVAAVAIDNGISASRLAEVIFPHPTVAEIIKETINSEQK